MLTPRGQLWDVGKFPSPSGDPLFKLEMVSEYGIDAKFPSPSGNPLFKLQLKSNNDFPKGRFRPLPGILYSNLIMNKRLISMFWFPSPSGDPLFKLETE